MPYYTGHGLTFDSDLPLPMATAQGPQIDIVIRQDPHSDCVQPWDPDPADVVARSDDAAGRSLLAARTVEGYRILFSGRYQFDLDRDLRSVRWSCTPDADTSLVGVLFMGPVVAFRFAIQGELVLHAGAVARSGRGLALVGRPKSGKSTLTALLCEGGATFLTDDVARTVPECGRVVIYPAGLEARLRPASTSTSRLLAGPRVRRQTEDGRAALLMESRAPEPVALGSIVVPVPDPEITDVQVIKVSSVEAVLLLSRFPRLPGWVDATVLSGQFERLADVVELVPVHVVRIPWKTGPHDGVAETLFETLG